MILQVFKINKEKRILFFKNKITKLNKLKNNKKVMNQKFNNNYQK